MNATEATLAELLLAAQMTNVSLVKLQSLISKMNTGGGGGGGAIPSTPVTAAFSVLSIAAASVTNAFAKIGNVLGYAIGTMVNFSLKAAEGAARVSDFYLAFKDLPFLLGSVAELFAEVAKYSERLLDTYRRLTESGASFSGDLFLLATQANKSYLGLKEFSAIITANSKNLSQMFGTTTSGVTKFVEIQNKLMGPESKYGQKLLAMGFTFDQIANATMGYMRTQGTMNKNQKESIEDIIKSTYEYAVEIDTISKLTGIQRDVIQKNLDEMQMEEAWQQYLAALDPAQVKAATSAITNALETGGKDYANRIKLGVRGINVAMTEAQRAMEVASGGMITAEVDQIRAAVLAGKSMEEMGIMVRKASINIGGAMRQTWQGSEQLYAVVSANGDAIATSGAQLMAFNRNSVKILTREEQVRKERDLQEKNSAAIFTRAELAMKRFGMTITGIIINLIEPLAGPLADFTTSIIDTITKFIGTREVQSALNWFVNWISTTVNTLSNTKSMKEIWETLVKQFGVLWDKLAAELTPMWELTVKPALISMFDTIVKLMSPYLTKAMNSMLDGLNAFIYNNVSSFLAKDPEKVKILRTAEAARDERNSLKEDYEKASKLKDLSPEQTQQVVELGKKLDKSEAAWAAALAALKEIGGFVGSTTPNPGESRHKGTIGMTGSWWEKSDATLNVATGESVVTPEQLRQISGSNQEGLAKGLQQLNSLTAQLLNVFKENTDYTKKNYYATTALNGDLFAT